MRSRLSALIVVISLMTATAGSAFALAVRHECPPDGHACCNTPRLVACCPGDDETPAPSSTPAASRTALDPIAVLLAVLPANTSSVDAHFRALRGVPNRSPGPDLTTLLGALRI